MYSTFRSSLATSTGHFFNPPKIGLQTRLTLGQTVGDQFGQTGQCLKLGRISQFWLILGTFRDTNWYYNRVALSVLDGQKFQNEPVGGKKSLKKSKVFSVSQRVQNYEQHLVFCAMKNGSYWTTKNSQFTCFLKSCSWETSWARKWWKKSFFPCLVVWRRWCAPPGQAGERDGDWRAEEANMR